jgi:cold-inducible RNA-binding protein
VGNLNFRTTPEQLQEFLAAAGDIVDVYFATDRETGRPRGFAFVTFAEPSQAQEAIRRFNGVELDGRSLNINEAKDRERPTRPSRTDDGPSGGPPRRFDGPPPGGGRPDRGSYGAPRFEPAADAPPGEVEDFDPAYDKRHFDSDFEDDDESGESASTSGGGGDGGDWPRQAPRGKPKKPKGSRRGLRARKRSL